MVYRYIQITGTGRMPIIQRQVGQNHYPELIPELQRLRHCILRYPIIYIIHLAYKKNIDKYSVHNIKCHILK